MYTYTSESPYGSSTNMYSQPTSNAGGQIPVMTWNPPQQQAPNPPEHLTQYQLSVSTATTVAPPPHYHQHQQQHCMRSSAQLEKPVIATQQPHPPSHYDNNTMVTPRPHSFPVMPAQTPIMATQQQQQPGSTQQQQQQQQQPKLATSFWEDEGTICYQVDANNVCVARRQDNDMVNGTKLLNVVGMSRGKRDGILKNERGRVVVKVGAMHLKGVWITISRAKALAAQYNISDLLHPLFTDDPAVFFYAAPPPPPPMLSMPPGYYYPHTHFAPPPPPPPYLRQHHQHQHHHPQQQQQQQQHHHQHHSHSHSHQQHHHHHHHPSVMETDVMARAPSIPSMGPSVVAPASTTSSLYSYPTQQQQHQPSLQHFPYMDTDPSLQQEQESPQSQFPPTAFPFEMENASGTSLVDYASRAGGSSSMLSGITAASDSAPTTPGSQQYHNHQLHLIHPYDSSITTPSTSTTALSLMEPTTTSLPPTSVGDNNNSSHLLNNNLQQAMIDEYGRPMNMFIPPYYDPSSHQQQQDSKWYSNPLPPSHHQQQPW